MNNSNNNSDTILYQITFFERLLKNTPDFIDALIPLAHAYTEIGEYTKGLKIDKRLSRLRPQDSLVFYNLACSFSLLNMIDESLKSLQKSIQLGYNDLNHLVKDKDLESIRSDQRFSRMVALVKKRQARLDTSMKY